MLGLKRKEAKEISKVSRKKAKKYFCQKKGRDNLPSVQQQIQGEGLSSFCYREFC